MKFLEEILKAIEDETGLSPIAFTNNMVCDMPSIIYSCYAQMDDGSVEQWRLQTRVVAENLTAAYEINEQIRALLVSIGDKTISGCYITMSGGGILEDPDTGLTHVINYFDLTKRS